MKRWVSTAAAAGLIVTGLAFAGPAVANGGAGSGKPGNETLQRYAYDTWASLDAMTDEATGLPSDNITGDLSTPGAYTSPTNIGGYLWSTVTARDLGIITADEARDRMATTLDDARDARAQRRQRHVLQLVRPRDGREADHVAGLG